MTREQGGSRHDTFQNILRSSQVYTWTERLWYTSFYDVQPIMSVEEYAHKLENVIQRCKNNDIDVILVIGWAFLDDYPNLYTKERYKVFQDKSREVGESNDVRIIDMGPILQSQDNLIHY